MVDIHHEGICNAPLPVAFAYVDDYRTATSWMFGLSRFEPVGGLDHGLGATFAGTFAVKPVKLSSTIEVTEWEQDSVIAFDSIKGFTNRSTWRFSAAGEEHT
ncbi:MAG TPA: SRPBCC family protein, partial [Jatrophihabitans sp.]|uniref:SRPBCC family protein n=1 Tax=Jatrophihabitans sp. TaxID=1932789 RepID=UPI002DF99FD3|nr:SRPBCC family protein [Jatrophihabitans sp.]